MTEDCEFQLNARELKVDEHAAFSSTYLTTQRNTSMMKSIKSER